MYFRDCIPGKLRSSPLRLRSGSCDGRLVDVRVQCLRGSPPMANVYLSVTFLYFAVRAVDVL